MFSRCLGTLDQQKLEVQIQKQIDRICNEICEELNKNKPPVTGGDFGKRDFGKQYPNLVRKKTGTSMNNM